MQILGRILALLFAPLASLAANVAPAFAAMGHRAPVDGDFTLAAVVVSAGTITILSGCWAAAERIRRIHTRHAARSDAARAQSAQMFRDALISASGQPIVVMGVDMNAPISFAGGSEILKSCLAGPDAARLAPALDALLDSGVAFEQTVFTAAHNAVTVRGTTVGGRIVVFFRDEQKIAELGLDGRRVLDALPVPVWVRNKDLALRWVNRAFLNATGSATIETALQNNTAFDKTELELAAAARDDGDPVEAKRYAVVAGQRRALNLMLQPLADAGVAGAAVDVTDVAQAEIKLQGHIDALQDVLDSFETAVAAYGEDRRLVTFNSAFAQLWDLPEKWLRARPTISDVVDRLREERHLPEQRDYAAWKRNLLEQFDTMKGVDETLMHLRSGKSLRLLISRNAFGGLTFRFTDVTDRLKLESACNMLTRVQKSTLDTLSDGVALIGPDGRIAVSNAAFAKLWHLTDEELAEHPHIRRVAELCAGRIGRDQTWEIVASGVASAEPERLNDWGKVGRADGKAISLTMARLPDGGTLATFEDLTEAMRFEAALRARDEAAA